MVSNEVIEATRTLEMKLLKMANEAVDKMETKFTNKHKENLENLTSMILDTTERLQIEVNNKMEAEEKTGSLEETVSSLESNLI